MEIKTAAQATAFDVGYSPPLTSSLHSRNSASSAQESAYLRRASVLRWARLGLSGFVLGLALVVVGCTSHVLQSYNHTHLGPEWHLPLWPVDVDLKPTTGLLVPAAVVTTSSLVYLTFAIIPSPRSRTLYQTLLFSLTSATSVLVVLFAVIFNFVLLRHIDADDRDTLQTWTCKLYQGANGFEREAHDLQLPFSGDALVPAGFHRLCVESMTSQWMTVGLFVVEVICCGVAAWGLVTEKRIKKCREMRYQGGKCESEFE